MQIALTIKDTKKQVKIWARNQAVEHANMVALSNVSIEADS